MDGITSEARNFFGLPKTSKKRSLKIFIAGFSAVMIATILVFPSIGAAIPLPPVPRKDSMINPTASGMAKIDAMARSLADVVCFSGAAIPDKWFPLNISANGTLSVWWVRITAGCSRFDAFEYTFYEGYGTWYQKKCGGGNYYPAYSVMTVDSPVGGVFDETLHKRVTDNDFSSYDTGWSLNPPPDISLRLTGRRIISRQTSSNSFECSPYRDCGYTILSSLVSSTGSLVVQTSRRELENLYLPDPVPFDVAGQAAGIGGACAGAGPFPMAGGTNKSVADYTGYLNAGALALLGADIESIGPGVDISAPFVEAEKINLLKSGGDNQSRTVTKSLQQPLTARVNDAQGNPKTGVAVSFQEKSSPQGQIGFAVNQTQLTTDAQGVVSANVVLGNKSGTRKVLSASIS